MTRNVRGNDRRCSASLFNRAAARTVFTQLFAFAAWETMRAFTRLNDNRRTDK